MLNRTQPPAIHNISLPELPHTLDLTLGEDIPVTVLNQGEQPVLLMEIIFPAGRLNEPSPGITHYTAKMFAEGTKSRSAEAIASAFDFYGSHLEINATLDFTHFKLYALNRFFPELIQLLAEILSEASFPEKEFETLKKIRIQQIKQQHAKNNAYAGLKFRQNLFGPKHPYGMIIDESMAADITLDQVRSFKTSLLVKPCIFLSGKITDQEIHLLESIFINLPFSSRLPSASSEVSPGNGDEVIAREGSTQASIRIGHTTTNRQHPDIHKLKITNELFGGYFGSRLMKNIREDKGLTYSIHSSLSHLQEASYWTISTEILHDKVDLAVEEITLELEKLRAHTPTEEELHTVTNYMKGKYINSFDTPFHSLNMIKNLKLAGLSSAYLKSFVRTLDEITPTDIRETANAHLDMDQAISVTVS